MVENLREIWQWRWLLYTLISRDLKIKYRGSYFGFALSIMLPVIQVAVLTYVFKFIFNPSYQNYSALLFSAILPWNFTQTSVLRSCNVVRYQRGIVRRTYFPREILPLALVLSNLVHFGLTLLLFIGFLIVVGHGLRWSYLGVIGLVALQTALSLGLAMFAAAVNILYHDLETLITYSFMLGFYLSPILYQSRSIAESPVLGHFYPLFMLNPMAGILEYYRHFFLGFPAPEAPYAAWAIAVSGAALLGGYTLFRRVEWRFPEMV